MRNNQRHTLFKSSSPSLMMTLQSIASPVKMWLAQIDTATLDPGSVASVQLFNYYQDGK